MSRGHILVVDDEEHVQALVRLALEREGYAVRCCGAGDAALEEVRLRPPDLVVLDVLLPGRDGLEVCRSLRAASDVPIILLTARASEEDKLAGLASGADDYVTKPFSPLELAARVGAVLRRVRRQTAAAGGGEGPDDGAAIRLDPGSRRALVRGRAVALTPTEFRLLAALLEEPGRVFTRAQLIERAFGPDFAGFDRNVDVHIMNLRRKLALDPTPIRTVYGVGYKLEAP